MDSASIFRVFSFNCCTRNIKILQAVYFCLPAMLLMTLKVLDMHRALNGSQLFFPRVIIKVSLTHTFLAFCTIYVLPSSTKEKSRQFYIEMAVYKSIQGSRIAQW